MSRVQLALYKGPGTTLAHRVTHAVTCLVLTVRRLQWCPYSHAELVIDGVCHSSSLRDGGVRRKRIDLTTSRWVVRDMLGIDADAALRRFAEREGSGWADGGFFGVPYDQMSYMHEEMWHINEYPIQHKPVEGYTVPAFMLTADKVAFTDRAKDALLQHLMASFASGVQSLIDECIKWGVSDKHLETMAGWERGAVRAFRADNPGLRWSGFVWDQL